MKNDQFRPPKKDMKGEKILRKTNLRNVNKKIIQSSVDSNDQTYVQKTLLRAAHWWHKKIDRRYFKSITPEEVIPLALKIITPNPQQLKNINLDKITSYFKQKIMSEDPDFFQSKYVRALFRRQFKNTGEQIYEMVSYNFKQIENTEKEANKQDWNFNTKVYSFQNLSTKTLKLDQQQLKYLTLEVVKIIRNNNFLTKCLDHDIKKKQCRTDIDAQIQLWQQQINKIYQMNEINYKQLQFNIENNKQSEQNQFIQQIYSIKKNLRCSEILLYFTLGHSDKTQEMLKGAKQIMLIKDMNKKDQNKKKRNTRQQQLKCLFQTDCKICFCTESQDRNKVLYCDECNTSFHQSCYGINRFDDNQKFYCQVCQYIHQQKERNPQIKIRKPSCQLCCKANFPMKKIQDHFYHITCLFLLNLIEVEGYLFHFKKGLNYNYLQEKIIQNQLSHGKCQFCYKKTGIKLQCSSQNCFNCFHPICAYLDGVLFDLIRNYRTLKVNVYCGQHFPQRDFTHQVYLRRFFCDYKRTSAISQDEFYQVYLEQLKNKEIEKNREKQQQEINPILKKTRMVQNRFSRQQQKNDSSRQNKMIKDCHSIQIESLNKLEDNNALSIKSLQKQTQTKRLLKRIN